MSKKNTVQKQLKRMVENYPSLFRTRFDILNHLFLVIGNGYKWRNGQLVDVCGDDDLEPDLRQWPKWIKKEILKSWNYQWGVRDCLREKKTFDEVGFYPMCEYSKLATIPKDIQDDWHELALEAYCMVLDSSSELGGNANNIKFIEKLR